MRASLAKYCVFSIDANVAAAAAVALLRPSKRSTRYVKVVRSLSRRPCPGAGAWLFYLDIFSAVRVG